MFAYKIRLLKGDKTDLFQAAFGSKYDPVDQLNYITWKILQRVCDIAADLLVRNPSFIRIRYKDHPLSVLNFLEELADLLQYEIVCVGKALPDIFNLFFS